MSTGMIITVIVIVVAVLLVAAALVWGARGRRRGGSSLKRRFGPEYERTVARHDGDTEAAERELAERVERHGDLRERPLEGDERERYEARWTAVQEHFVDSPRQAVAEADQLLAELAGQRGYPGGERYEDQFAALSVHHAGHVDGYRRVHRMSHMETGTAASGSGGANAAGAGTEEMRSALVSARALFDDLTGTGDGDHGRHRAHAGAGAPSHGHHLPWTADKSRPKES
ncbi:hypothetical protein [Streptomyces sp. NPDC047028]|uniref:hypothetical protein n=1 Tax=Streptomyces sp. NPDC047028 TaxID=3155793 RepID=UPI0033D16671